MPDQTTRFDVLLNLLRDTHGWEPDRVELFNVFCRESGAVSKGTHGEVVSNAHNLIKKFTAQEPKC